MDEDEHERKKELEFLGHVLRSPRGHHNATVLAWTPWAKGKSAAPNQPGTAVLGQWRAGSAGRKQAPWLRTGASGRGVVRPYAQQSPKTIGEVHVNVNTLFTLG